MTVPYKAIGWTPFKRVFDSYIFVGIMAYLIVFALASLVFTPHITPPILLVRATGTAAMLLLHIILCVGPLCRLNSRFLPMLYNRRHMGVLCFFLALAHGTSAIWVYHSGSSMNPVLSVFASDTGSTISSFPFQTFGALALLILLLLAATSHDFWLRNLTAPVWKTLHMLIYIAYAALVIHVVMGVMQSERQVAYSFIMLAGVGIVVSLHLVSGIKELVADFHRRTNSEGDYVETVPVNSIPNNQARIVTLHGERVAIFRYGDKISAVSNVCPHQNGPLGEGRIIDGCITCPWHGFQFRPEDGQAPHPHQESIPTFEVRIRDGKVWVNHKPRLPGTPVEAAEIPPE